MNNNGLYFAKLTDNHTGEFFRDLRYSYNNMNAACDKMKEKLTKACKLLNIDNFNNLDYEDFYKAYKSTDAKTAKEVSKLLEDCQQLIVDSSSGVNVFIKWLNR